jgi:hypothetical protein
MKLAYFLFFTLINWFINSECNAQPTSNYRNNRAPLITKPYIELPLGSIKPRGWLKDQLLIMKNNSTGHLDSMYAAVCGPRNGWLGGDGDQWERGPYWLDGLVPLAYILNDSALKAKAQPWIEWSIKNQQPDGYFGPMKDYGPEPGLQRDNAKDWWPKMVMLKVLMQYYSATEDQRVINLMTNYFKYQLKELPKRPLDKWTFWAAQRGGDNMMAVYWLYNITGDKFLLELTDLLHRQTFNWTENLTKKFYTADQMNLHGVNVGQGMKEPVIYYQQHPDKKYLDALRTGMQILDENHGLPQGMWSGDEWLHGTEPTQGSEMCANVETMFTLETMLPITADVTFADRLERITFNAYPTQATDDFNNRQYFQQVNQVEVSRKPRPFAQTFGETVQCYGWMSGYPCCIPNMHQGWTKFTQNLFYATADKGVAALVYSPAEVNLKVANGTNVHIVEETGYPFDETIKFTIEMKSAPVLFPFHFRIPTWCKEATVSVNGKKMQESVGGKIINIKRIWKDGDVVELSFPMEVQVSRWYQNSAAVERGPLVYALKIGENWKYVKNNDWYGNFWEVYPTTPWNYGLVDVLHEQPADEWEKWNKPLKPAPSAQIQQAFKVVKKEWNGNYPWNLANAPIEIKAKARRIPEWTMYNGSAGPIPPTVKWWEVRPGQGEVEEITLVPYGCTTLRITEFPVVSK